MFKVKNKIYKDNLLQKLEIEPSKIQDSFTFTLEGKSIDDFNKQGGCIHNFEYNGLVFEIHIDHFPPEYYGQKHFLEKLLNGYILVSRADFDDINILIFLSFESFLKDELLIKRKNEYEANDELTIVDEESAFSQDYNYFMSFVLSSYKFNFLGFGRSDDNIKVYIEDMNNNILDGIVEILECELPEKSKHIYIYSKILMDDIFVKVIVSETSSLFSLFKNKQVILKSKSNEKNISFELNIERSNSDSRKNYDIQFLSDDVFVLIVSDKPFGLLGDHKGGIDPKIVLQYKTSKFSAYQKVFRKINNDFSERIKGFDADYLAQQEEQWEYEHDEWSEMEDETKQDSDFERWISENDAEDRRNENDEISYEELEKFKEKEIFDQFDLCILKLNYITLSTKGNDYIETTRLDEKSLVELTCVNSRSKILKIHLKMFSENIYLGNYGPNIFAFVKREFCEKEIEYLHNFFCIDFYSEGSFVDDENNNHYEWNLFKGKFLT